MKNKIEFGTWEAMTVLVNLIFAQVLLTFPKDMAYFNGSAGWMIPIIITIIILTYFAITSVLYKNIGSIDLLDICEGLGGRMVKVIAGFLIAVFLLANISVVLGGFSQTLKIISLDKSPLGYIEIIFLLGIIAAAYFGIEPVVRINTFLVPVIIFGFLIITIGVIPKFELNNLYPVLGEGYMSIAKGSIYKLSAFSPLLILFFMVPFFKKRYIKRVGYLTIIVSGALLFWSTLSFLMLFPYQIAIDKKIPVFQMAKHIEFGSFIQRIESVFVLICSLSSLLYLSVFFTFLVYITGKTLSLKKSRPIIFPMAILVFCLADISKRLNLDIINTKTENLIWLSGLILPFIILILGAARKIGKKEAEGGGNEE